MGGRKDLASKRQLSMIEETDYLDDYHRVRDNNNDNINSEGNQLQQPHEVSRKHSMATVPEQGSIEDDPEVVERSYKNSTTSVTATGYGTDDCHSFQSLSRNSSGKSYIYNLDNGIEYLSKSAVLGYNNYTTNSHGLRLEEECNNNNCYNTIDVIHEENCAHIENENGQKPKSGAAHVSSVGEMAMSKNVINSKEQKSNDILINNSCTTPASTTSNIHEMFQVLIKSIEGTGRECSSNSQAMEIEDMTKFRALLYQTDERYEKQPVALNNIISSFKEKFSMPNAKRGMPARQRSRRKLELDKINDVSEVEKDKGENIVCNKDDNITVSDNGTRGSDISYDNNSILNSVEEITCLDICEQFTFVRETTPNRKCLDVHNNATDSEREKSYCKINTAEDNVNSNNSAEEDNCTHGWKDRSEINIINHTIPRVIVDGDSDNNNNNYDEDTITTEKRGDLEKQAVITIIEYENDSNSSKDEAFHGWDPNSKLIKDDNKTMNIISKCDKDCATFTGMYNANQFENFETDREKQNIKITINTEVEVNSTEKETLDTKRPKNFTTNYGRLTDLQNGNAVGMGEIPNVGEKHIIVDQSSPPDHEDNSSNVIVCSLVIPQIRRYYEDDDDDNTLHDKNNNDTNHVGKYTHEQSWESPSLAEKDQHSNINKHKTSTMPMVSLSLLAVPSTIETSCTQQIPRNQSPKTGPTLPKQSTKTLLAVPQSDNTTNTKQNDNSIPFLNSNGSIAKRPMLRHVSQPNMNAHHLANANYNIPPNPNSDQTNPSSKFQNEDLNSDLAKLKATAVRLNLSTRRPSYLRWLEDRKDNWPPLGTMPLGRSPKTTCKMATEKTQISTPIALKNKSDNIKETSEIDNSFETNLEDCSLPIQLNVKSIVKDSKTEHVSIDQAHTDKSHNLDIVRKIKTAFSSNTIIEKCRDIKVGAGIWEQHNGTNKLKYPTPCQASDITKNISPSVQINDVNSCSKDHGTVRDELGGSLISCIKEDNRNGDGDISSLLLCPWKRYTKEDRLTPDRKLRIEKSLEWLQTELKSMRNQDQQLARQLLALRQDIHSFKYIMAYQEHRDHMEDVQCDLEDLQEFANVLDLPNTLYLDTPLKNVGVTKWNITARRFSTC